MNANLFAELQADENTTLSRLHHRLERDADTDGVLDVAYRTIDTPVGTLLLAATAVGLVRVAFDIEDHAAVLAALAESVSPRILQRAGAAGHHRAPDRRVFRQAAHHLRGAG